MKSSHANFSVAARFALAILAASSIGCASSATDDGEPDPGPGSQDAGPAPSERYTTTNQGGTMEGHTPRGFQGQGTGLFVGDNLNAGFPDGDGVQMFLSFDVSAVPAGEVVAARFFSENGSVSGTPYMDLGTLTAEETEYTAFSSELYNFDFADGHSCAFATQAAGPFECDIAPIVQRSLDDGRDFAQVRLRFDLAGDSDGSQDLATFFITDSNTNEPGIFELEIDVIPSE